MQACCFFSLSPGALPICLRHYLAAAVYWEGAWAAHVFAASVRASAAVCMAMAATPGHKGRPCSGSSGSAPGRNWSGTMSRVPSFIVLYGFKVWGFRTPGKARRVDAARDTPSERDQHQRLHQQRPYYATATPCSCRKHTRNSSLLCLAWHGCCCEALAVACLA